MRSFRNYNKSVAYIIKSYLGFLSSNQDDSLSSVDRRELISQFKVFSSHQRVRCPLEPFLLPVAIKVFAVAGEAAVIMLSERRRNSVSSLCEL